MTGRALLALALLLAAPLAAQDLSELPEDRDLPPAIASVLTASLEDDQILDRVRMWQGDLLGDAAPDLLVQAAIAWQGGNAYVLRHWIFRAQGGGWVAAGTLSLPDGIKSATLTAGDLVITLYKSRPGDPRCCPSGEERVRVPLN